MLRSVGALIFGSLSDRYGRKWPFVINLSALIVLELGTGFTHNLSQFLAVRSLFGIAMGGTCLILFSLILSLTSRRAIWTRSINSTRRPPLRSSRYPLGTLRARLRDRLPPRRHLLPRTRPHNLPRLARSILVRRRSTSSNHRLSSLSPGNKPLPRAASRARNQTCHATRASRFWRR